MKSTKFYILVTAIVILSILTIVKEGVIEFLIIAPAVLSILYLIKSFRQIVKSNFSLTAVYFLICLQLLMISIKLDYEYYNALFATLLFLISIWLYRANSSKPVFDRANKTLLTVTIVNLVLLMTPNDFVLDLEKPDHLVSWKSDLTFEDFSVINDSGYEEIHDTSRFNANIRLGLYFKLNSAYNYPPAVVLACMDKTLSFKKKSVSEEDGYLLEHEQIHFNINKYYADKANDSLSKLWGEEPRSFFPVVKYFHDKVAAEGDLYDSLTNHGLDTLQQAVWTKRFKMD